MEKLFPCKTPTKFTHQTKRVEIFPKKFDISTQNQKKNVFFLPLCCHHSNHEIYQLNSLSLFIGKCITSVNTQCSDRVVYSLYYNLDDFTLRDCLAPTFSTIVIPKKSRLAHLLLQFINLCAPESTMLADSRRHCLIEDVQAAARHLI